MRFADKAPDRGDGDVGVPGDRAEPVAVGALATVLLERTRNLTDLGLAAPNPQV